MDIHIGVWAIPIFITVIALVSAHFKAPEKGVEGVFMWLQNMVIALLISLASWIAFSVYMMMK